MKITEKVGNIKNKSDNELKKKTHTHTHAQKEPFNVYMH